MARGGLARSKAGMSVRALWRLWGLGLVAFVLAWLVLQNWLSPSEVQTVRAVRQSASLPALAPLPRMTDSGPDLAALSQSAMWGPLPAPAASGAAQGEAPPPKWSLTGFFANSGRRFVVVSFEGQARPSLQLGAGDKLPDGSRIVRIDPDRVLVRVPSSAGEAEGASSPEPTSSWLPITPGLPMPAAKQRR